MKISPYSLIFWGRRANCWLGVFSAIILASLLSSSVACAGIAIGLTRVIVTGDDRSGSVQILNKGTRPILLQLWIDNHISEMDKPIEKIKVPFVVDTPVFRLDPMTNKSIRIYYTGNINQLPSDRESMFWLNVLEVPAKTGLGQAQQNEVQIAFRSRIKLFYRPAGIAASSLGVVDHLSFKWVSKGNRYVLQVTNPTPFNVTFQTLYIAEGKNTAKLAVRLNNDDMVGPKDSIDGVLVDYKVPSKNMIVYFSIIDDFGAPIEGHQVLELP